MKFKVWPTYRNISSRFKKKYWWQEKNNYQEKKPYYIYDITCKVNLTRYNDYFLN